MGVGISFQFKKRGTGRGEASLVPASTYVGPSQLMHDDGVCRACGTRVMLCCYAWWDALMAAPPGRVKKHRCLLHRSRGMLVLCECWWIARPTSRHETRWLCGLCSLVWVTDGGGGWW